MKINYFLSFVTFWISFMYSLNTAGAQNVIDQFDLKVSIDFSVSPDLMDVGITKEDEDTSHIKRVFFKKNDLEVFFERQRVKNIVYVELLLVDLSGEDQVKYLDKLINYFKERGFKRIIIAHNRMVGPLVLKDVQF